MHSAAEQFFNRAKKWKEEMQALRSIILSCKLEEDFKWMHPCYTLEGNNVVLIHAFKEYCALLFFKGVLMKDPQQLLIQQTANVQDRRQLRFTNLASIRQQKAVIKKYIQEAIRVEASGAKVEYKKTEAYAMPEELKKRLAKDKKLKTAFEKLTPGRQRGYILFIGSAKQSATRESRIDKYIPNIMAGKGPDE